jgi:hypothetical protein
MLKDGLLIVIALLFVVSMLAMISSRLRISYPILLVLAGLGISIIPGIPEIRLDPDMVFIIFLPPLLWLSVGGYCLTAGCDSGLKRVAGSEDIQTGNDYPGGGKPGE